MSSISARSSGATLAQRLAFVAFSMLVIAAPMQGEAAAGRTVGSFAVSGTGSANYTIPLWVPPGPRGIQPSLALVYDNRGGGGTLGVGWSLAGLSAITRCNKTYAQDGAPSAVTLTYNDAFCLDGKRLRLTSSSNLSTYGQPATTYQTELADFSLITAVSSAGNGPASFVVKEKEGLTYEFGNGGNSQVLATGTSTASAWMLSKVSDRANNRMIIAYSAPDASLTGTTLPATISWTPSSDESSAFLYTMEFQYVANAPASSIIGYVAGTSVLNADLLASISVKHSGTTVRKYVLTYGTSPTTGAYRLAQVKECADAGETNCLSPTTITYQNGQVGTTTTATNVLSGVLPNLSALYDFNGDGYADLSYINGTAWFVSFGSATGFGSAVPTGIGVAATVMRGDLKGTGTDGFLASNGTAWWYYAWNGTTFSGITTGAPFDSTAVSSTLADIDSDGRPDLVTMNYAQSGAGVGSHVHTRLNTSSAAAVTFSASATNVFNGPGSTNLLTPVFITPELQRGRLRAFDFNGDTREDVAVVQGECLFFSGPTCLSYLTHIRAFMPESGASFAQNTVDTRPGHPDSYTASVRFVNWNNDACTDLLVYNGIRIAGCNGQAAALISVATFAVGAIDWNSDGRTDVLTGSGGVINVQLSTGSGLTSEIPTSIASCGAVAFDANGDGLEELGCHILDGAAPGFRYYAHNGAVTPPDLATSIADGYGLSFSPSYVPMVNAVAAGTYEKAADATYPYQNYIGPSYLVTSFSATDDSGAGTYTGQLKYTGGWMNLQGRGFSGFDSRRLIDSRTGLYEYAYFRRDFPFTGRLREQALYQSNGTTLIRQQILALGSQTLDNTTNNQRYFVFVSGVTAEAKELGGDSNGELITTSATTYTFDNYGNATQIATSVTDKDAASPYYNQQWTTSVTQTITPDAGTNWCLGLPTVRTVTNTAPGVEPPAIIRTVNFTPDYANCRISQKVTEPASTYTVTEVYGFDGFGNINSVAVTGDDMATRTSLINWGATGQFPSTITNALGQATQQGYHPTLGLQTSLTDPNGIVTGWEYDEFGRKRRENRPDGTARTWAYNDCASAGCVNSANRITVTETVLKEDESILTDGSIYLDRLGRTLVTSHRMLSGAYDREETQYDAQGRLWRQAAPCTWGACASPFWTTHTYDSLNRLVQIQRPISATVSTLQTTTVQYAGRKTTTTDPQDKKSIKITTVAGTLGRSQDHNGHYQSFVYDAFGSLLSVTDGPSTVLFSATYHYGVEAFPHIVTDADLGQRTNTFNALGELIAYVDAKFQSFGMAYDPLSRLVSRSEPGLTTSWTWGNSAASHNIGRLEGVSADTYAESYSYDEHGRPGSRTITIPGDDTYTFNLTYQDQTGLLDTLTYPTSTSSYRLKLQYTHLNGLLQKISDFNSPATAFWTANATNSRGQVTQETLGNGVVTNRTYDAVTGWLSSLQSGLGGGAALQNESYVTDLVGNITERQNTNVGLTEDFHYDNLYRLDYSTLGGTTNLDLSYDAMGNILSRTDVAGGATWSYHPTKKHAVTQAGSSAYVYTYDANGNVTARSGYSVSWTSYNRPSLINGAGGESVAFSYNHSHERWRAVLSNGAGLETTYFIGGLLEKVVGVGNVSDFRHYVFAGGTKIAVYSRKSTGENTLRYIREDHQGSISGIISSDGTSFVKESFTAFGKRRSSCTWSGAPTSGQLAKINGVTRRGYTWHTALGDMGLNDMNGRIQDAVTGRFLSPDAVISDSTNPQSYNRYSYVMNNPLSLIDPSGFVPCTTQNDCVVVKSGSSLNYFQGDGYLSMQAMLRAQIDEAMQRLQLALSEAAARAGAALLPSLLPGVSQPPSRDPGSENDKDAQCSLGDRIQDRLAGVTDTIYENVFSIGIEGELVTGPTTHGADRFNFNEGAIQINTLLQFSWSTTTDATPFHGSGAGFLMGAGPFVGRGRGELSPGPVATQVSFTGAALGPGVMGSMSRDPSGFNVSAPDLRMGGHIGIGAGVIGAAGEATETIRATPPLIPRVPHPACVKK